MYQYTGPPECDCCGTDGSIRYCNKFCHNCDGGCSGEGGYWKDGSRVLGRRLRRRSAAELHAEMEQTVRNFKQIDQNGDGRLSMREAWTELNRMSTMSAHRIRRSLMELDANNNGWIEPGEFDDMLATM